MSRAKLTYPFKASDAGVWADGSLGHDHIRRVLRDLLVSIGSQDVDTLEALRGDMSDDAWEEDAAIEELNDACEGCCWDFVDGDLVLRPEPEGGAL